MGGSNNVLLMGNGGTAALGGGALSGSSGSAFSVDGGNAVISYSGSTTNGTRVPSVFARNRTLRRAI